MVALLAAGLALPAQAASVRYVHTDALGSVVAKTDADRNVLERREYEPFGAQLLPTPGEDGPGYTGHVQDAATGLTYMQQRYYDPGIGRFLSVDPVTANAALGANFNRYWYANNNPFAFTDPDGRFATIRNRDELPRPGGGRCDGFVVCDEPAPPAPTNPYWRVNSASFALDKESEEGDSEDDSSHFYQFTSRLCDESSFGCTPANMMSLGLDDAAPFARGLESGVRALLFGNNPIIQVHDWESTTIRNFAQPGHWFNGTVEHHFYSRSGSVFVTTTGTGASDSETRELINVVVGSAYFRGVYHPQLAQKAQQSTFP